MCWRLRPPAVEELDDQGSAPTGRKYIYDNVFGPGVSNAEVYERQCREIVRSSICHARGFGEAVARVGVWVVKVWKMENMKIIKRKQTSK